MGKDFILVNIYHSSTNVLLPNNSNINIGSLSYLLRKQSYIITYSVWIQ